MRTGCIAGVLLLIIVGIQADGKNGLCSNAVFAASARSRTYYVATNGRDRYRGTENRPFRTIARGASVLMPGDTLIVKGGTYTEELFRKVPSGTSWTTPVTIKANPGETVIIRPPAGANRVFHFEDYVRDVPDKYIMIEGLILDGINIRYDCIKITGGANHIRIKDCEIMNAPGNGVIISGAGCDDNEIIGCKIHDNGRSTRDHGIYVKTENNLIEGCEIHHNSGYGVHVYNETSRQANCNTIKNCRVYNQASEAGILLASGEANAAQNNLVWSNHTNGIKVNYGATNSLISDNTIYDHRSYGVYVVSNTCTGTLVRKNFVANSGWGSGTGVDISNQGTETVIEDNVTGGGIYNGGKGAIMKGNSRFTAILFVNAEMVRGLL
ncbi:MAG: right-handed parallel beta-helix repeat-containing protein [Acidobacteria bacterium]|nr:right-handed parallel beta-helix repeat-containing protein [Acidobacteriota bacterium]